MTIPNTVKCVVCGAPMKRVSDTISYAFHKFLEMELFHDKNSKAIIIFRCSKCNNIQPLMGESKFN